MQTASIQRRAPPSRKEPAAAVAARASAQELQDVVGGLSGAISARLAAELAKKVKVPEEKLRDLFETTVPHVLQAEFESNLLSRGPVFRAARAKLAHLLSTAELAEAVPDVALPVTAVGDDDHLTSEEAAELLHVSRSHVNTLADSGAFGDVIRTPGRHRRLARARVLAYREKSKQNQARGLEAMMAASKKAGLYDLELEGTRRRRKAK
ncbi:MAG TPA: helix-turn-helix domain-containing protein [Ramlibacter sp.]|uniref:helix-turn-helix domain-containing protein n=1 Tax=Ramlibacter sp. TaxID=1917967 RepID=UPI002C84A6B3|nr:helix-turn-helix domain-containing protein [Ramlibacter sp.]HVZ46108.1 helix-turn-helix domain-containing protein [Ramlibacter sp.]